MNVLQQSRMLSNVIRRQLPVISKSLPVISTRNSSTSNDSKVLTQDEKGKVQDTTPRKQLSFLDKVTLQIFGDIKGDIPNEVSYAVIEKADSKRRIAVNILLMVFCGLGSLYVVHNVKKNLKNKTEGNVYAKNLERYEQTGTESK